jgi:DNA-directed RNA polymerase subunit RPC12/RpoP
MTHSEIDSELKSYSSSHPSAPVSRSLTRVRCPYCRGVNLRNSRMRLPQDLFYRLVLHHHLRCRTCDARFLRWLWMRAPEIDS